MTTATQDKLWNSNYIKVWLGNFLIHFAFTLIVPLLPLYLSDTFGATRDTIGLVLAGYSVMAILVRPFSGFLVDSLPRRAMLLFCYFLFFAVFAGYLVAGSLTLFAIFRTIHGLPFGATAVSISTAAIDVLPSSRRTEGIGYYGLSSNFATAIGPALAIWLLKMFEGDYQLLFGVSMALSFVGLVVVSTIKFRPRDFVPGKPVVSLDRFFLLGGIPEALAILCYSFSYGILSTYVAIYGRDELGIEGGTGLFFTLFAVGLIVSRLTGAKGLRDNRLTHNAAEGVLVSVCGYLLFAAVKTPWAFYASALVIGLGNGHMFPAFQNMFINLAENNQRGTANSSIQTSWDTGVGLGILFGGLASEYAGYHAAFWVAFCINLAGVAVFFLKPRRHFESHKLR